MFFAMVLKRLALLGGLPIDGDLLLRPTCAWAP